MVNPFTTAVPTVDKYKRFRSSAFLHVTIHAPRWGTITTYCQQLPETFGFDPDPDNTWRDAFESENDRIQPLDATAICDIAKSAWKNCCRTETLRDAVIRALRELGFAPDTQIYIADDWNRTTDEHCRRVPTKHSVLVGSNGHRVR